MTHRSKDEITKALAENLDIITPSQIEVAQGSINRDTEKDIDFSRKQLKDLISKSNEAIDNMMALASEAEHPRAFEVLSTMLKQSSEMTQDLVKLQKLRKDITQAEKKSQAPQTTNNAIFVGSTTELQKFLKNNDV